MRLSSSLLILAVSASAQFPGGLPPPPGGFNPGPIPENIPLPAGLPPAPGGTDTNTSGGSSTGLPLPGPTGLRGSTPSGLPPAPGSSDNSGSSVTSLPLPGTTGGDATPSGLPPAPGGSTTDLPLPGTTGGVPPAPGGSTTGLPLPGTTGGVPPAPGGSTTGLPPPGTTGGVPPAPGGSMTGLPLPGTTGGVPPAPGGSMTGLPLPGTSGGVPPAPGGSTTGLPPPGTTGGVPPAPGGSTTGLPLPGTTGGVPPAPGGSMTGLPLPGTTGGVPPAPGGSTTGLPLPGTTGGVPPAPGGSTTGLPPPGTTGGVPPAPGGSMTGLPLPGTTGGVPPAPGGSMTGLPHPGTTGGVPPAPGGSMTGLPPPVTTGGDSVPSGLPPAPGSSDNSGSSLPGLPLPGAPLPGTTGGGSTPPTGLPPTTENAGSSLTGAAPNGFSLTGPPPEGFSLTGAPPEGFSLTGPPPGGATGNTGSTPFGGGFPFATTTAGSPPADDITGGESTTENGQNPTSGIDPSLLTGPPPNNGTVPGTVPEFPGQFPIMQGPDDPSDPQADPSAGPFSNYNFENKHETPFNYEYHGEEKCAIINVAMDESGSMVDEQEFMRSRAIKKMVGYLSGNKHQFDKVFVCSNGFGNTPGGNMEADPDGYRHLGCSLGYNKDILMWSYWNEGRNEDGYSATIKSINNVPEVIDGVNITSTCKTAALNMILVTDEDRDAVTEVTKEDVRQRLAETGYIYNIVVNVFIKNAAANIIGMRYNYNSTDFPRLNFPNIDPQTGTFRFYDGGDIPNEIFSAKMENGVILGEYVEEVDPTFLYKELMTNGQGHTIEDYGEIIEGTKGTIFSIRTMRKGLKGMEPGLTDAFANALVDIKVCEMTQCREPEVGGDPHITTWKNEHYEFHGQCDLVLAKDPDFAGGMGLDVHIRTKIVRYWSYIQAVAIRIGDDILEVEGGTEMNKDPKFWINFEYLGDLTSFAGFPVIQESNKIHRRSYTIDLGSKFKGKKIVIDLYREFVRVKLDGGLDVFGNTVGLLGDPRTGELLARDAHTEFDDYIEFGNEWQVLPADGNLFHEVTHPAFPEKCIQPEDPQGERHRRLSESSITIEQAEKACAGSLSDPLAIHDCVYDVLATQDLGMTGAF